MVASHVQSCTEVSAEACSCSHITDSDTKLFTLAADGSSESCLCQNARVKQLTSRLQRTYLKISMKLENPQLN